MVKRLCSLLGCGLAVLAVGAPVAAAQPVTVIASGTGQTKVHPQNRHNNASIAAAYAAAEKASIAGAVSSAHQNALAYAAGANLTLGSLVSLSDQQNGGFSGPGASVFFGPFGPGQFCGTERLAVIKVVKGKRKVVRTRKVHRCIVPEYAYTTLVLTYDATSNG
jgi:hypothetical protein